MESFVIEIIGLKDAMESLVERNKELENCNDDNNEEELKDIAEQIKWIYKVRDPKNLDEGKVVIHSATEYFDLVKWCSYICEGEYRIYNCGTLIQIYDEYDE